jgi:phosphonate transport system ATP-binding protein
MLRDLYGSEADELLHDSVPEAPLAPKACPRR